MKNDETRCMVSSLCSNWYWPLIVSCYFVVDLLVAGGASNYWWQWSVQQPLGAKDGTWLPLQLLDGALHSPWSIWGEVVGNMLWALVVFFVVTLQIMPWSSYRVVDVDTHLWFLPKWWMLAKEILQCKVPIPSYTCFHNNLLGTSRKTPKL